MNFPIYIRIKSKLHNKVYKMVKYSEITEISKRFTLIKIFIGKKIIVVEYRSWLELVCETRN